MIQWKSLSKSGNENIVKGKSPGKCEDLAWDSNGNTVSAACDSPQQIRGSDERGKLAEVDTTMNSAFHKACNAYTLWQTRCPRESSKRNVGVKECSGGGGSAVVNRATAGGRESVCVCREGSGRAVCNGA